MTVLRPTDGTANKKGAFPCGRSQTEWESKEFRVPEDLNCDTCVVSLEFFTERGPIYMCSDIEVLGNADIPECYGQCLNGGICQNGKCVCTYSYSGSNCQFEEVRAARGELLLMLLIYGGMILLILATLFATYLMKKRFDLV